MRTNVVNFLICAVLGIILSFAQAPYDYWFLIFPVFSGLYYLYCQFDTKKSVFFGGFLFALAYFISGLHWIGNALLVDGNEFKYMWPLAVIALPCLLSLFTASSLLLAHIFTVKKTALGFIAFCTFLTLSEFTRGYIFTGFPWNLYGYTWLGLMPIAQISSVVGPYGLTLLTILWGGIFGYIFLNRKKSILLSILVISSFFAVFAYGQIMLSNKETENLEDVFVRIVQPNIPQKTKWEPDSLAQNFKKHIELSKNIPTDKKTMIIWPETAIPPTIISSITAKKEFQSILNENTILLTGGLKVLPSTETKFLEYYNAIIKFDGINDPEKIYSKSHLVPFGEYIPFQQFIPLKPVVSFTGFKRGNGKTTLKINDFPSFSPQICYEIIFPDRMVNKKEGQPEFILTVTNDAWYGDSAGPRQHFASARFRAIEQGIPVLRAANTGISGIINPYGQINEKLPLLQTGFIDGYIPKSIGNPTFYGRFGHIIFLLFSGAIIILTLIQRYK